MAANTKHLSSVRDPIVAMGQARFDSRRSSHQLKLTSCKQDE